MAPNNRQKNTTLRESKSALLDAANAAVADRGSRAAEGPPPAPSRVGVRVMLGLLIIGGASLLVTRPAWLVGTEPQVESPAIRAASATLAMARAIGRVQAYAAARGGLPANLEDAGVNDSTIQFRRIGGDAFEVSVPVGNRVASLRSTDSIKPLMVDAIRTLQGRS